MFNDIGKRFYVCISMDDEIDPTIQNLIHSDVLFIDAGCSLGCMKDCMKTNECLHKLQFLVSLVCNVYNVASISGSKQIKLFREKLKKLFNVPEVYMGDIEDYYKVIRGNSDNKTSRYIRFLNIYNDLQIYNEVFESPDTLKSFVMSPNSWLYITDCYNNDIRFTDLATEMYCGIDEYDFIATVDYGGNNKIDVPIKLSEISNKSEFERKILSKCKYIKTSEKTGDLEYDDDAREVSEQAIFLTGDEYSLVTMYFSDDLNEEEVDKPSTYNTTLPKTKINRVSVFDSKKIKKLISYKKCKLTLSSDILRDLSI